MTIDKIVAWELVGYTNDGQVIQLSDCPKHVSGAVDTWIAEIESDDDITREIIFIESTTRKKESEHEDV